MCVLENRYLSSEEGPNDLHPGCPDQMEGWGPLVPVVSDGNQCSGNSCTVAIHALLPGFVSYVVYSSVYIR